MSGKNKKKAKSRYEKYRYPVMAVAVLLTWIFSVTYVIQKNTPESQRTHLYSSRSAEGGRGIASVGPSQGPLLKEVYVMGVNAYLWGSGLVRMEQISREFTNVNEEKDKTSYYARVGEFGHARKLPGPGDKGLLSVSRDTLYSSAIVDLAQSPMVLTVPKVGDRYYSINIFDMWHNLIEYVESTEGEKKLSKILLVPPDWNMKEHKHSKLKDLRVVKSSTTKVWLLGRTQIKNESKSEYQKVHAIQDKYKLTALSDYLNGEKVRLFGLSDRPGRSDDPLRFFSELGEYLLDNTLNDFQSEQFSQFEKIGLTKEGFKKELLTLDQQAVLEQALIDGEKIAKAQINNPRNTKVINGWNYVLGLNEREKDFALRSMVTSMYLGEQNSRHALGPICFVDANSRPLIGSRVYRLKFKSAPPVKSFWSIAVYDKQTKGLVYNTLKRYSIGSNSEIDKNPDGSFELTISNQIPVENKKRINWLAAPSGPFYIVARLYSPKTELLEDKWSLPSVEQVEEKIISFTSN